MKKALAVALPILAVLLYVSVSKIPEGSVGIQRRGDGVEVLRSGLHLHRPFAPPIAVYSLSQPSVAGETKIVLADGGSYTVGFDIAGKIDPNHAAAFHAAAGRVGAAGVLKEAGEKSLVDAAAARPPIDLATGALETDAARLAGMMLAPAGVSEVSLRLRPLDGPGSLRLALALAGSRQAGALRAAVTQLLATENPGWEAHTAMGLVLESEKDLHGAEKEYLDALTLSPAALPPMAQLVAIYSAVGEHGKLDRLLEAAIQAQPTSIQHLGWHAMSMLAQNKLAEAQQDVERALSLDPKNVLLLNNMGAVQVKEGRMDEAIATFRKAVESKPGDRQSLFNLGVALSAAGKDKEALPYLLQAEQAGPPGAPILNAISRVYRRSGDVRRATEYERRAAQIRSAPAPGS